MNVVFFLFSFNLNAWQYSPNTLTCIQEDYDGFHSILWVFKFNEEFTELLSLENENYTDFSDFFILTDKKDKLIFFKERILGNKFIINLEAMTARWNTAKGNSKWREYYCKDNDLRSKL